jgi:sortase A
MGWRTVVREVGLALVAAGVVVLLFVVYELFGTNVAEQHSQAQLARQFAAVVSRGEAARRPAQAPAVISHGAPPASHRSSATARQPGSRPSSRNRPASALRNGAGASRTGTVSPPLPPPGGALDHLVIPAIGVDRYVVQGVDENDLQEGPGHYPGTALPGQPGNVAIAGHRTTFGAPFFRLNELVRGDLIYLTDLSGTTWVYSVQRQWVVAPTDVAVLDPTRADDLTLTTCTPRFLATSRLVVRAQLVERFARGAKLRGSLPVRLVVAPATPARGALAVHHSRSPASAKGRPSGGAGVAHRSAAKRRSSTLVGAAAGAGLAAPAAGAGSATSSAAALPSSADAGEGSPVVGPSGAGGAESGTLAAALGWGALAVAVWVAARLVARRRLRYAKVGVLAAGALVCLVPLWFAFGAAVGLLPANF